MVKSSILLGAIPLLSGASALFIPLDKENALPTQVYSTHKEGIANAQNEAAKSLPARKRGCGKKRMNAKHKGHHKGHKEHHAKDVAHGKHHKEHPKHLKHHGKHHSAPSNPPPETSVSENGVVTPNSADKIIPDSYIVVLKEDAADDALATSLQFLLDTSTVQMQSYIDAGQSHSLINEEDQGFSIKKVYEIGGKAFRGYAGRFLPEVAELLAQQPEVAYVEKDSIVHTTRAKEEEEAPWGLARVSHRKHLGLGSYNRYKYDNEGGEGVTSYIVDTGIYIDHEDFEGRAVWGKTIPLGDTDNDAHGHGSHCAGTIGGKKYGVAKKAKLVAVKVLGSDGSGSMSDVIGGVEYVVEAHRKEQKEAGKKFKGSTANMSLGGGKSPSLDIAVNAAVAAGVHFAVAAGNDNQDACYYSPASATGAVTVGATDIRDDRAYFSNYGKCVDIFAPGVNVLSVGTDSTESSAIMSGTSMASPHIAGLLTYFVSLQPSLDSEYSTRGQLTTKELKQHLIDYGTHGSIADLDAESPNVIAYNGGGKDLSNFWVPAQDADEEETPHEKKGGFLHRIEDAYENVVDYLEDLVEESQEVVGNLF